MKSNLYNELKYKYIAQKASKYILLVLVFWTAWTAQLILGLAHLPVSVFILK